MERLRFDSLPIEFFYGGVIGVTLTPYIGLARLNFLEEIPVRFRCSKAPPRVRRNLGDEVVLYALHYSEYVKLGSTGASQAFSRMYSQAPVAGTALSKLIVARNAVNLESSLEKPLAEKLGLLLRGFEITTRKKNVDVLIRNLISGEVDLDKILSSLRKVSEASWGLLWGKENSYAPITPLSEYWLTTVVNDEDLEVLRKINFLRKLSELKKIGCNRKICKGKLTILHNAICVLSVGSVKYVTYCDEVSYNILMEVE